MHFETGIMSRYYDEQYYIKRHAKENLKELQKADSDDRGNKLQA
jgi:hypothetical protein